MGLGQVEADIVLPEQWRGLFRSDVSSGEARLCQAVLFDGLLAMEKERVSALSRPTRGYIEFLEWVNGRADIGVWWPLPFHLVMALGFPNLDADLIARKLLERYTTRKHAAYAAKIKLRTTFVRHAYLQRSA